MLDGNLLEKICFIVMGDGPLMENFVEHAKGIPVIFTGRLCYSEMVWILRQCDIAVNPISRGAAQSIINKHMDYAMAGLPVINTQENKEYRDLLDKYNAGINCPCDDSQAVMKAIQYLSENEIVRKQMGNSSKVLGSEQFDRSRTYMRLYSLF